MTPSEFWDNVNIVDDGGESCWEWRRARSPFGHGHLWIKEGGVSRKTIAHREAYRQVYGPIAPGLLVRHYVCDNPPCCNPLHHRQGTHAQNNADTIAHGRHQRGPRAHWRPLHPPEAYTGKGWNLVLDDTLKIELARRSAERKRAYTRQYLRDHPDKRRAAELRSYKNNAAARSARNKDWRLRNAESHAAKKKEYQEKNKDAVAAYQHRYHEEHKEAHREYQRRYREENKAALKTKAQEREHRKKESARVAGPNC